MQVNTLQGSVIRLKIHNPFIYRQGAINIRFESRHLDDFLGSAIYLIDTATIRGKNNKVIKDDRLGGYLATEVKGLGYLQLR